MIRTVLRPVGIAVGLVAAMTLAAPRAVADEPRSVTFDDLKFDMDKQAPFERSLLTPAIEALSGQTIKLRGFILPTFQTSGLKHFVLVRDNKECCFGPGAALCDAVIVKMSKGQEATFTVRPVLVEGKFAVDPMTGPDGKTVAVFRMVATKVR